MKHNRIELRASQKEHERLLEAALFTRMNLSAFLRQAALEKSDEVLKNRDTITLSDKDREIFFNALEDSPKANKKLQQAFKTYKKKISKVNPISPSIKRSSSKIKKAKVA